MGRSHRADYQISGTGVSNIHLEVALGTRPDETMMRGISQNGAGVVRPGGTPRDAICLQEGEGTAVKIGSGILAPMSRTERGVDEILWMEVEGKGERFQEEPVGGYPTATGGRGEAAYLAKCMGTLPQKVQDIWLRGRIEDARDLRGFDISAAELKAELGKEGVPKAGCGMAARCLRDAARDSETAEPVEEKIPRVQTILPLVTRGGPISKKR